LAPRNIGRTEKVALRRQEQEVPVGTGSVGYVFTASPAFLLLTGCFGISAAIDPPPVVASANTVVVRACAESSADPKEPKAAKVRETVCLKELAQQASRKGSVLSLKIDGGMTKTFRSNPAACKRDEAEKCAEYYLVGFDAAAGAYLVFAQGYENYDFKLVNVRTGETTVAEGVPRFAPDNSTFFARGCYDGCSISIKSTASSAPAWQGSLDDGSDWDFVRWIDNDQVAFRTTKQSEHCPRGNCGAILKRISGAWKLESAPAT
jgi:hypothetical protein